mmetsp:Transcript_27348/g.51706  ORF Transcript_27348/g.51706 Transcript_27348/m.51706 type:complete len:173 (-) Transcript_27348:2800-3318(-)
MTSGDRKRQYDEAEAEHHRRCLELEIFRLQNPTAIHRNAQTKIVAVCTTPAKRCNTDTEAAVVEKVDVPLEPHANHISSIRVHDSEDDEPPVTDKHLKESTSTRLQPSSAEELKAAGQDDVHQRAHPQARFLLSDCSQTRADTLSCEIITQVCVETTCLHSQRGRLHRQSVV